MRRWKRVRRKMKNFLLKCTTFVACILWLVAGSFLDSVYWIPFFVILIISSMWIFVFSYANGIMDGKE